MMGENFFNPTGQLLADSQARLAAVTAPPAIAPAQPAPTPPAADLVRSFEQTADQYGVPVDALLALAEKDSGFDHLSRSRGPGAKTRGLIHVGDDDMARGVNPYVPEQAIGAAARKLRGFMDRGATLDDALRAHGGGGEAGEAYRLDITQRAKRLADSLYPAEAPVDPAAHNMDAPKPAAAGAPGVLGTLNDMRVAVDQGLNMMVQDIDGVARKVLPERVMSAIDAADRWLTGGKTGAEAAKAEEERLQKQFSPKMRESLAKKWWNQEKGEFGDAFSDWRAYAGAVLQSLPESVATSGPALKLAKGAYALNIARGATPAAAAARAATVATVAGAVTEGALGGAQSEREVKEEIEKLPIATLRQSEAFKTMVAQGMSEAAARQALARDAGARAFVTGGLVTGVFGGMGDRIIARTILGRAGRDGVAGMLKRAGASFAGEGLAEELPQSALQQIAQNEAIRQADPDKRLMDDVANQALGGAVTGGLMGVGMGGAFRHATRDVRQPSASAPSADEATPASPPVAEAPAPPSGPLGRALAAGAPHLVEASMPAGRQITITETGFRSPDGRDLGDVTVMGHVIAQDRDSVTVQADNGQLLVYGADEIASGVVKFSPASQNTPNAAPAPGAVQAAPSPSPEPAPVHLASLAAAPAPAPAPETPARAPALTQERHDATAPPLAAPHIDMPASASPAPASAEPSKANRGQRHLSADEILSDPRAALASGDVSAMRLSGAPSAEQLDRLVASARKIEDEDVARAFGPDADTARRLMRSRSDADQAALEQLVAAKGPEARAVVFGTGASAVDAESLTRLRDTVANIEGAVDAAAQGDLTDLRRELAWIAPKLPDAKASPEAHGEGERIALLGLARAFELGAQRGIDMPAVLKSVTAQALERTGGDAADAKVLLQRLADHAKAAQGDMPAPAPSPRPALPSPAAESPAAALPARAGEDRAPGAPVASPAHDARASASASAPDTTHAPDPARQVEAPATPAAAKPARQSVKQARAEHDAAIADYFAPGNIVRSYGGHDRVVAFERDARGEPVVTVEAVRRVAGEWETTGEPRRHSTMPDRHGLSQGPVERAAAAAARPSVAASAPATGMTKADLERHLTEGADGALMARLIDDGHVTLHETPNTLPGEAAGARGAVQGVTTAGGRVHLVASNLTPDTARGALLHEAFHAGAEPLIGAPAMRGVLREVGAQVARAKQRIEAGKPGRADGFWLVAARRAEEAGTPDAHMAEEIAAYAVERVERAPDGLRALADRVVGAVKAWMLRRFGRQFGDVTPEQLRALAVSALRSWRDTPLTTNVAGVRYSLAAGPKAAPAATAHAAPKSPDAPRSLFDRAREEASTFLTALMVGTKGSAETVGKYSLLSLTPTRALFNELAKPMPSAQTYLRVKEAMDAQRNNLTDSASAILDKWEKFARADRAANKALMDIMHRSTLEQVDPSKPFEAFWTSDDQAALDRTKRGADQWDALAARKAEDAERRKAWEAMQAEFKALPPRAQTLYGEVRDAYKEMADAGEAQVVKNIQKALDHLVTKAERQHADEMQRIRDEGLTGDERDAAEKAADDKLAKVKARTVRNRAARVKNMRAEFESNRIKGPYFPLSRFGNYFVTVRDADGKVVSFSRFESARQQRRFATEQRAAGLAVEEGVASAKSALERNLDPKFVAEVESILDGADAPDSVRDAIWQKYLETLPDFSARKSRLHRKGRAGFAADAMRAFAHNMFHGSHQLARLTHGQDLQSLIEDIRREARDAPDPVRAGAVANEIVMAHDFAMNPKASPWALRASSFAFLWTMGANLSSAIVNLDQAWTKGIPNLAYDEETKAGVRAAARETAKATRDFIVGRGSAENASTLTADERAAMHAGYESGLIDKTQAHDVAGIAEAGLDYNPLRHKAMKIASAPMHQTERLNREVTFLASYRIARNASLSHEMAVRKAADLTWMTHFDNQSSSKPRFMRGDAGRTMFALKAFQANILFRLFRDMHKSMHGASPDARRMAFGRLTSTMALTAAAAGVRGAYFYSALMLLAGAFMGMLGDDDDPEEKLRKIVLDAAGDSMIGQAVGGMLLDGIPGYITGTALSERLGMGDLWLRTPQRDMKPEQAFSYIVDQLGGAPLSLAHNVFLGASEAGKGNVARGVEKAAPAAMRNAMKAARYAREGVKDKSGDDVVEDVPLRDVLKQAIGFTPAEIADRYARNTFQQNTQDRINAERRSALQAAARAERAGDDEAFDRAMEKVDAFNERYPDREITPKDIRQSRKGMERTTDGKEFGVRLHKGLEDFIKEKTAPSIYSR